ASPHEVYEMLMDSKKHAKFTRRRRANISRKVGGKISAYDGYITGENVELVEDKKIVQLWRGSDWPEGVLSKATFSLKKVKGGTKLTFTQTGVPDEQHASIKQGWIDFYWKPMKEMLGG
ncbi:MAG: SRPBCC family protein, partial [Bacteroidota bacterium]